MRNKLSGDGVGVILCGWLSRGRNFLALFVVRLFLRNELCWICTMINLSKACFNERILAKFVRFVAWK